MSSEWSLLMANQALARAGSFVFDPFVGTGDTLHLINNITL
jgi:tRNA G10  N-methylase Trm11